MITMNGYLLVRKDPGDLSWIEMGTVVAQDTSLDAQLAGVFEMYELEVPEETSGQLVGSSVYFECSEAKGPLEIDGVNHYFVHETKVLGVEGKAVTHGIEDTGPID